MQLLFPLSNAYQNEILTRKKIKHSEEDSIGLPQRYFQIYLKNMLVYRIFKINFLILLFFFLFGANDLMYQPYNLMYQPYIMYMIHIAPMTWQQ